jgi:hypothetical protein
MAEKRVVELEVKVKDLIENLEQIQESFAAVKESVDNVENVGKKTSRQLSDGFSGVRSAVVSVGEALSFVGLTLKTLGIGLLLEGFTVLKQVFLSNQIVADEFRKTFLFTVNLFNGFVNFLINKFQPAGNSMLKLFADLAVNITTLGAALIGSIFIPLKKITLGFFNLGQAAMSAFSGPTGLPNAVLKLKEGLDNLGDPFNAVDIIQFTEDMTGGIKELRDFIMEMMAAADATVELDKKARLAAAEQEGARLKALTAQEKQRRIRDDIRKDINDRIAANEELSRLQVEQIQKEKELAQIQVDAAKAARIGQEINIDLQIAEIEAKTRLLEIDERILAQTSEQRANEAALQKEKLDFLLAEQDAKSEVRRLDIEGELAVEDGILDRLNLEKKLLDEELALADIRLQKTKEIFGEGTIEYENALAQRASAEKRYNNASEKNEKLVAEAKRKIVADALGGLSQLLGESTVAGKAVSIAQAIINTYEGATKALGQGGIFGPVAAAGVIASGLATVNKIVSTKIPGTSDTASSPGIQNTIQQALPPSFNVVGASPINQISQALSNREPVKAYVVSGDVTTAQQLDRNIINESGI